MCIAQCSTEFLVYIETKFNYASMLARIKYSTGWVESFNKTILKALQKFTKCSRESVRFNTGHKIRYYYKLYCLGLHKIFFYAQVIQ